jgi:CRP/FNR family transcriptional regulator, anaerobic regulatory protein
MNQQTDISDILLKYFKNFQIPSKSMQLIISSLQPLTIDKGEDFSLQGKVCNKIGILVSGLLYAYYYTDEGEQKVSRFFYIPKNDNELMSTSVVTSFESFRLGINSNETITAIEKSELYYLSKNDLEKLYEKIPEMNYIGREIAEHGYIQTLQRVHSLQAVKNEQRFMKFFKETPELFTRLKIQHITSYLGMNRNEYSKLMKKVKK